MKKILFYDTETTGLPNWKTPSVGDDQPHIVQLGAILVNKDTQEIIQSLDLIIKPDGWVIPQETIEVHGITNELAAEVGVPEGFAITMLRLMRGNAERVAYNKTFDQRIVRIAMKRFMSEEAIEKWSVKEDHHCAMRMAQKEMGGKNPKLINAYKHFTGDDLENAHNAMADTLACMKVYFAIKNKENEKVIN